MKIPTNVIGCASEEDGEEVCSSCRGKYFDSDVCKEARSDGDYQLIYGPEYVDQITVFVTIYRGVIDTVEVCDTPEIANTLVNTFLEEEGYANLDEYEKAVDCGHVDTEFETYTRNVLYGVEASE